MLRREQILEGGRFRKREVLEGAGDAEKDAHRGTPAWPVGRENTEGHREERKIWMEKATAKARLFSACLGNISDFVSRGEKGLGR